MNAGILTIGDELLLGQVVDTNSSWMGKELSAAGIKVSIRIAVGDDEIEIIDGLKKIADNCEIILITGGLGPTRDDITKKTLNIYFGGKMIVNAEVLADVKYFFERVNRPMLETNLAQAEVPDNCLVLRNKNGTAPGMWFEQGGKVFVSMPGVPMEMKAMMHEQVIPMLQKKILLPFILHRTIVTSGIGESFLAEKIKSFEDELPEIFKLAYLPNLSQVRLRLTASSSDEKNLTEQMNFQLEKLKNLIAEFIVGYEEDSLEKVIGDLLRDRNQTLSTAESCTGGFIAHKITSVPGSSIYFPGSVVTYSYEMKTKLLGVKKETLEKFGAVSEETVLEMSEGALKKFNSDYAIAVSGIAGPDGGTADKPVGTVWIAVRSKEKVQSKKFNFFRSRLQNIEMTEIAALDMLRKMILQ